MLGPCAGIPVSLVQPELPDRFDKRHAIRECICLTLQGTIPLKYIRVLFNPVRKHHCTFQPDRKAKLTEGKPVSCGQVKGSALHEGYRAPERCIHDGIQQGCIPGTTLYHQLRDPRSVGQEAADAEWIVGEKVSSPADSGHIGDFGRETWLQRQPEFHIRCLLQFAERDEAVKGIVLAHGRDKGAGKIDAHLPVHPLPGIC